MILQDRARHAAAASLRLPAADATRRDGPRSATRRRRACACGCLLAAVGASASWSGLARTRRSPPAKLKPRAGDSGPPAGVRSGHLRAAALGGRLLPPPDRRSHGGGIAGEPARRPAGARERVAHWTLTAAGGGELERLRRPARARGSVRCSRGWPSAGRHRATTGRTVQAGALQAAWRSAAGSPPRARPPQPAPLESRPSEVTLTDAQAQVVDGDQRHARPLRRASVVRRDGQRQDRGLPAGHRRRARAASGQVLVLVPEIALTPQLVERFQRRFSAGVVVLHSALERQLCAAMPGAPRASGEARIIIGTRSAVFTSLEQAQPHRGRRGARRLLQAA